MQARAFIARRVVLACVLVAAVGASSTAQTADSPFLAPATPIENVGTLAGSGRFGLRDGPLLEAEFMAPAAVAYDASGRLYVADRAAQRIRMIDHGMVTTIAGSGPVDATGVHVEGGYADGPAATARFNEPVGVVAMPDGSILVADRLNHCIRRIANGIVSTFAGSPQHDGSKDGPRTEAEFHEPHGITVDTTGTVYVADYTVGVRSIARDGTVAKVKLTDFGPKRITSVSASGGGNTLTLYAVEEGDVVHTYRPGRQGAEIWRYLDNEDLLHPYGVAAVSGTEALVTDVVYNDVKLLRTAAPPFVSHVGGGLVAGPPPASKGSTAGYRDGPADQARFSAPAGIAVHGREIAIADLGNRRIRMMPFPDLRGSISSDELSALSKDPSKYRMLYIGPSSAFYGVMWRESTGGLIESRLLADRAALGIPRPPLMSIVRVDGVQLPAEEKLVETYAGDGQVDLVLFSFTVGGGDAAGVGTTLRTLNERLTKVGTRLLAVVQPSYWSTPEEAILSNEHNQVAHPSSPEHWLAQERATIAVVKASGVPYVAPFEAYLAYERSDHHLPLFFINENHPDEAGNAFLARNVVDELERWKPWQK
ncbi:MAG TPA: hypothetical protein VGN14_03215 [Candidatus Elarobacter sp.]